MDHIPHLIIIGRPAAGKSEVIDYLKKSHPDTLRSALHLAPFVEIDDFPFVFQCFEIDAIYTKYGKPRRFTDERNYFNDPFVWDMLIERINAAHERFLMEHPGYLETGSILVEFARGGKDGFGRAFSLLREEILRNAAVLYIKVSYEESVRKNRRRARPGQEHSILHHSLRDDQMEFYYKDNDWQELSGGRDDGFIEVKGVKVPFVALNNEPEVTDEVAKLGPALTRNLDVLHRLYQESR